MELPYYIKNEGTGGEIKEKVENFIVEEIPLYNPSGEGQHLYINITKKGLNSKEVKDKIADIFQSNKKNVGMAGLKDKWAVTTQTFSVDIGNSGKGEEAIEEIEGIKVNWFKRHRNKIKKGHTLGNRFKIIISGTDKIEEGRTICKEIKKKGIPNFYGQQRFSDNDNNIRKAEEILNGYQIRDNWLKRFLLSSYQSYLFNKYLILRINKGKFGGLLEGDIAKKYDTGGLFVVEDKERENERFRENEISFTGPIYGKEMWWPESEAGKFEEKLLERFLDKDKLGKLGRGSRRLGKLMVDDITIKKEEEGLLVKFSLPKGSYATIVLREIMKSD